MTLFGSTTPISPLGNQTILATPAISVSTTPYSLQYIFTMNSPILSSKLTTMETKMCGKMMIITSYFKDELQSLKKDHHASNCTIEPQSPKKSKIRA